MTRYSLLPVKLMEALEQLRAFSVASPDRGAATLPLQEALRDMELPAELVPVQETEADRPVPVATPLLTLKVKATMALVPVKPEPEPS